MIRDKEQKRKDRLYSAFVRSLGVCVMRGTHGIACEGDIVSCHIRKHGNGGTALKPRKREVPMCFMHHDLQHRIGEVAFWGDLLWKAIALAEFLYENIGNKDKAFWALFGWKTEK